MSDTLNAESIARALQEKLDGLTATVDTQEVSHVDEVGDGIARVSGLRNAMAGELSTALRSVPSTSSRKATSAAPPVASWIFP